jgi:argininosuccinate synthase
MRVALARSSSGSSDCRHNTVNTQRIVLAFNGHPASCAAVRWLTDSCAADVIALIVDVGQGDDPEEAYSRALACGARNVHVVDRCDAFARRAVVPAAAALDPLDERALRQLMYPVIAAALVEVAAIEGAGTVAHASIDPMLDTEIHALDPALRVLAPAREWPAHHLVVEDYLKMHRLTPAASHPDRHLLMRRAMAAGTPGTRGTPGTCDTVTVTIGFEAGVPRSVNGVAMELPELIESLSLIGRQCHIDDSNPAPALVLLQGAYRASAGAGSVTLMLQPDSVVSAFRRTNSEIHA